MRNLSLAALYFVVLGAIGPTVPVVVLVGTPPVAPVKPVTDDYFGTKIVDPYRWMEDTPNPMLGGRIKAQNDYMRGILASIPGRAPLLARFQAVSQGTNVDGMQLAGARMFFTLSTNGNTPKLYYRSGAVSHLVSTRSWSCRRARTVPSSTLPPAPTEDSSRSAYQLMAPSGRRRLGSSKRSTGRDLGDRISRAWGAMPVWVGNEGFFYSRLPQMRPGATPDEAEERQRVFFHRVGRDPYSDKEVFGFGTVRGISADEQSYVYSSPGSAFAIGLVQNGADNNADFYAALLSPAVRGNARWRLLGKAFLDGGGGSLDLPGAVDVVLHRDALYVIRFDTQHRTYVVRLNCRDGRTLDEASVVIATSDRVHRSLSAAADGVYVWSTSAGLSNLDVVDYQTADLAPSPCRPQGRFRSRQRMSRNLVRFSG